MNPQLSLLVRLQHLDLKIHDIEDQQQKIPQRLRAAQLPIDQATSRLQELKTLIEKIGAERRSAEQDLSSHEDHIQKMRTRLNELRTNKEYQAHLFEIDLAKKKKDSLEEKVLLVMERADQKEKEVQELETLLNQANQAFAKENEQLELLKKKLEADMTQFARDRKEVVAGLEKNLWNRYSMLKSSRNVVVIAGIRERSCLGCQLQLPPQLVADVKRADQLLTCPYCHRILYWEEMVSETVEVSESS